MNDKLENYTDHEVRIRLTEELVKDVRLELKDLRKDMHNQFLWIIGTILTLFGGIILHMAKLI